jgi:hypothetical protein
MSESTIPEYLSEAEVAAIRGISVKTLRNQRPADDLPFVRLSRKKTVYASSDVSAWLASRRVVPSNQQPLTAPVTRVVSGGSAAPIIKGGRPKGSITRNRRAAGGAR